MLDGLACLPKKVAKLIPSWIKLIPFQCQENTVKEDKGNFGVE